MPRFNGTILGLMGALALAAACSSGGSETAGGGGTTTQAGSSSDGGASATTGSATSSSAVTTGGFGGSFTCDPPAEPGSIYERTGVKLGDVGPSPMCAYRGDVMLIVNVAAV